MRSSDDGIRDKRDTVSNPQPVGADGVQVGRAMLMVGAPLNASQGQEVFLGAFFTRTLLRWFQDRVRVRKTLMGLLIRRCDG